MIVEDKFGFRVPDWVFDKEILMIAIKLGFLKIVVNPRVSGVEKKRGSKRGKIKGSNML